jgi:galactokinase
MAIDMDTLIAANFEENENSKIILENTNEKDFPSKTIEFDENGKIQINKEQHHWTNYALSGIKVNSFYFEIREL